MASGDLQSRLGDLPGVLSCTVNGETVALLLHPDVDPRLLKARAQAICAEVGESRPLIVVGGRSPVRAGAGAGVGVGPRAAAAAGAIGGGWRTGVPAFFSRRATPVTIAVLTLFVLSAVVLAPGDGDRPGPFSRPNGPPSVALAPSPSGLPSPAAPGTPAASPTAPSFDLAGAPLQTGAEVVVPGPVVVGLPASGFAFVAGAGAGQANRGAALIPEPIGIGTPLASPSPAPATAVSSSAGPGSSTALTPPAQPVAAAAPTVTAVQGTSRTSSVQPAASGSVETATKWSHRGRRHAPRKVASAEPQPYLGDGPTSGHEAVVSASGPEGKREASATARNSERAEGQVKAATPEKTERAQKAERAHHGESQPKPEQPSTPERADKGDERGAGRSSGRGN